MSAAPDRHLVELGFLEAIVKELGLPAQLIERSADFPYHTLLVNLDATAPPSAAPLQLAVTFYPVADDQLSDTLLLQYFIALPLAPAGDGLARVREWLPEINNQTAIGHFSLTTDHQQLHFRYVQALPAATGITRAAVGEVLLLVAYTPAMFAPPLAAVAAGTLTIAQARAQIAAQFGG